MRTVLVVLLFLSLGLFGASPTHAKSKPSSQAGVNKKQAVLAVKQKYRGKIMSIKEHKKSYKVRVMQPKGKVLDVNVNKHSGKVKKDNKNADSIN